MLSDRPAELVAAGGEVVAILRDAGFGAVHAQPVGDAEVNLADMILARTPLYREVHRAVDQARLPRDLEQPGMSRSRLHRPADVHNVGLLVRRAGERGG